MAYLTINSKFQPYSFQEIIAPLQMYGERYKELETSLSELDTKASIWEGLVSEQSDPKVYIQYKNFADNLRTQADNLASQGLNPSTGKSLLDLKKRYSTDIVPIEQAYTRRRQLADEQRKLLAQDNTLMFDRNASTYSLEELIKNPELSYQSYSGATLSKQVGTAAANLSKEMRENPRKWRSILGNQYFETIMQKGYRPEEIIQVMQNDPNASAILSSIVEDAVGSSNISSWGDNNSLNRAYEYARQGLWNAVGETQYQQVSDKSYDYDMQEELDRKKAARGATTEPIFTLKGREGSFYRSSGTSELVERAKTLDGRKSPKGTLPFDPIQGFNAGIDARVQAGTLDRMGADEAKAKYAFATRTEGTSEYTSDINGFLTEIGYSNDEISNLSLSEKQQIITSIANDTNDVVGRKVYEYQLDNSSFNLLKDYLIDTSDSPTLREVKSLSEGRYTYGKDEDIADLYDKEVNPIVYVDPTEGELLLGIKGKRYKLPKDVVGQSNYSFIQNNKSKVRKAKTLIENIQSKENPSMEEIRAYQNARALIADYNKTLEDAVYSLGYKVNPTNIAE